MYNSIIMPVDVFELQSSEKAIHHAEFLAQQNGKIYLLHVLPKSGCFIDVGVRRFEAMLETDTKKRLQAMVEKFSIPPERIETHIGSGSVRDAVNHLVKEVDADLVVIGSRNPSISTHLLGSTASSIVRHTHIPVMVVR